MFAGGSVPGPMAGAENSVMDEPWSLGSGESLYKMLRVTVSGTFPPPREPGFESQLGFGVLHLTAGWPWTSHWALQPLCPQWGCYLYPLAGAVARAQSVADPPAGRWASPAGILLHQLCEAG